MNSSDFRAEARKKLEGKWGKVALISLAYAAVFFVLGFIQGLFKEGSFLQSIFSLAFTIIEIPLSFGMIISLFKVYNSEEVKPFDFLSLGFDNFSKSWGITLRMALKLILPIILIVVAIILISISFVSTAAAAILGSSSTAGVSLLFLVAGFILYFVALIWAIMKSYYYTMSYVIAAENESLTAKEAVGMSRELMTGNRGKLFCLQFSFIGWAILAVFTLGIGYLWLLPYIQFATIAFYYFISNKNEKKTVEAEEGPINSKEKK